MKNAFVTIMFIVAMAVITASAYAGEYRLGSGDSLAINVWGEPDLTVQAAIRPDGVITMPGVGEVNAAEKTPSELQKVLVDKLKALVRNPIVTVTVLTFRNNSVVVHGQGVEPKVVPLDGRTTLLQLLSSIAPGNTADLKNAYVMRKDKKIVEGFEQLFLRGDTSGDIVLEPGDRVFIPYREDRFVFVLGAVQAPQAIPFYEGATILEVILQAGGFGKYADENDTVIVRKVGGKVSTIKVKGEDLIKRGDLEQNVGLVAGDYVIVREGLF
ncbi:polysaccharide biosynthesis/export family protein [Desulfovibrio subterraneus]|jgi:polysaccharide export outer membrane protein|uniref:Sugar ABC transporter substrate-binding protein n=1 Tax=Desulfovibrio subterraneus TaxID=2718620 RepID=A0A7J0BIY0_9BACT|nr:polysaccharide biosynthesis/export family protein [Desulfovibrio subterraneus]GFM33191.1 sugar ABC transporter substrate-binding protein [Desulfovibrio subterraneus]